MVLAELLKPFFAQVIFTYIESLLSKDFHAGLYHDLKSFLRFLRCNKKLKAYAIEQSLGEEEVVREGIINMQCMHLSED